MAQLEQWNSDVLALSAPTTPQFLDNEVKLARFDRTTPSIEERAEVRMASAEVAPAPAIPTKIETPVLRASAPEAKARPAGNPLVHQASLTVPAKPARSAAAPVSITPPKIVKVAVAADPARPIRMASNEPVTVRMQRDGKSSSGIDSSLARQIAAAAKLEASRGGR